MRFRNVAIYMMKCFFSPSVLQLVPFFTYSIIFYHLYTLCKYTFSVLFLVKWRYPEVVIDNNKQKGP